MDSSSLIWPTSGSTTICSGRFPSISCCATTSSPSVSWKVGWPSSWPTPKDVTKLDELELLLGQPVEVKVGVRWAVEEILQRSESAQRVLDEATEDFRLQLVQDDDGGEEVLSIDRITADTSPTIKLVDSTIFNAIQRRASDIHIETRETEVIIKYRIDGILYQAMEPIDKRHHQTIISRIKVMSELDISEKRVPQDGRFKLQINEGRTIDFRVSILPTVHGEDCRDPDPRQGVDEQGVQEPLLARHSGHSTKTP